MQFTNEEIERYHEGKSSACEKAAIEAWLSEARENLPPLDWEMDRFDSDWEKLAKATIFKKQKIDQYSFYSRIAASVILLLGITAFLFLQKEIHILSRIQLTNTSEYNHVSKCLDGVSIAVFPTGNASFTINRQTGERSLSFNKAVMIKNNQHQDINIIFQDQSNSVVHQSFTCKRGRTYSVFLEIDNPSGQTKLCIVEENRFSKNHSFDITTALYSQMVWKSMEKGKKLTHVFI